MAKGTLVIGVGGGGRGVLNHLKKVLEQEYGNPGNAGVTLYCIDGPVRDQYLIGGEYQIDTSHDSNEFYQLTQNPTDAIRNIAQGRGFRYIENWLQKEDAARVPLTGIAPSDGMGGERIPGRANLFLEVGDLVPELNRVISSTRSFLPKDDQVADKTGIGGSINIFLVGSQAGGTGAGLLLDIAHIIRKYKGNNARLIGVIFLPNSFNAVINLPGDVSKRDAKAFAGIRELHRFQGASSVLPIIERYSDNINISNEQLFDLCFLVDGQGTDMNIGNVFPLYGIAPSASDLILAMIKDTQNIRPNIVNWISDIAAQESSRRFSSYGIHTYIYPDRELLETFAVRFAKEVYDQIITQPLPPPGEKNEGEKLALGILGTTRFGNLAISVMNNKGMPTKPGDFRMLRQEISFGVEDAPFPSSPVLQLEEVVKKSGIFRRNTNGDVINDCENESKRYLGDTVDTAPQTIHGWLSYQSEHIQNKFVENLIQVITDVFYVRQTDGTYKSRPLIDKPYTLRVVSDLLNTLLGSLERLSSAFSSEYETNSTMVVNGVQTTIFDIQMGDVKRKHNGLQPDYGRDKQAQEDYIQASQKFLELAVWKILMEGSGALAQRLYLLIQSLWKMVGDPAQGWLSFFESFKRDLEANLSRILTIRSDLASVKVRRYFPSPNDLAEQGMFHDLVIASGLMGQLLSSMSWTFESSEPGQIGFNPKQEVDSYKLLLHLPDIPGFDGVLTKENLTNVITKEFRELILSTHSPKELIQYAKNNLDERLSKMTIWDAIHYDYKYEWSPKHGNSANADNYVDQLMNEISARSSSLLSQSAIVDQNIQRIQYCLSSFRNVPNAQPNSADHLATIFRSSSEIADIARDDSSMSKYIFMINYEHRVPLRNWAYYSQSMQHYFDYCFAYSQSEKKDERSLTPIHLFTHERNSVTIERYLSEHRLLSGDTDDINVSSIGIIPVRRLDISVVRHIGNCEDFTNFCLAYIFELIPIEESGRIGQPDAYYVDIEGAIDKQRLSLGPVWNIDAVLTLYLSNTTQGRGIRSNLNKAWEALEGEKRKTENWKEVLKKEILEKASSISFSDVPSDGHDLINREDLTLAMRAALCLFAEKI